MKDLKNFHLVDRAFLKAPKQYLIQSALAAIVVGMVLTFIETLTHAAIVAALGSTVFIVFAMPNTIAAEPRRIIGGNITGLVCGFFFYFLFFSGPWADAFETAEVIHWTPAALAVGFSILLMVILNFEHPPAAGIALGVATHEWSPSIIIFVVAFSISMALIKVLLKKYLKDLYT